MDKFFLFVFMIIICGYLWTDNHNRKQKQQFRQTIYHCELKTKSEPKDDGKICLADGNIPCHLLKNWDKVEGMLCLAENYRNGTDILFDDKNYGQDLQKSLYWYEQLAFDGYPDAQFEVAKIYEQGIGIAQNLKNANAWYYQAYLSNNMEAGFVLANHLAQGRGIEQNHQMALSLYNELANSHYEPAIFRMGEIYYKGLLGITKNRDIALQFFQKIPNYQGVSGLDGMLEKIRMEISLENAMVQKQLELQIPQQQYANKNKYYPSEHYGYSKEPTAQCWDGTYYYGFSRRGACSWSGGVKYWF